MHSPDLRAFYDQRYVDRFERIHGSTPRLERLVSRMRLSRLDDVVDFGCGSGLLLPVVAPLVHTYVGVDFSDEFIATALRRRDRLGLTDSQFECTTFQRFADAHPQSFDVGFALDVSEHVPDKEWVEMLGDMRRTLRPGGRLYLHTPNRAFFLERMKSRNFLVRQFPEHVAVRTMEGNAALLLQAGFQISRAEYLPHYNRLSIIHLLSALPKIGRLFQARLFVEATA